MTGDTRPKLTIVPCSLKVANAYVATLHRHHKPTAGHKFSVAVSDGNAIRGVAIAGRPVARRLDDGQTLEVNRVATDGCPNACSALYGAVVRAAKAMGYSRVITYTLPAEGGYSLRGAGFQLEGEAGGGNWNCATRPREDSAQQGVKLRWIKRLG